MYIFRSVNSIYEGGNTLEPIGLDEALEVCNQTKVLVEFFLVGVLQGLYDEAGGLHVLKLGYAFEKPAALAHLVNQAACGLSESDVLFDNEGIGYGVVGDEGSLNALDAED